MIQTVNFLISLFGVFCRIQKYDFSNLRWTYFWFTLKSASNQCPKSFIWSSDRLFLFVIYAFLKPITVCLYSSGSPMSNLRPFTTYPENPSAFRKSSKHEVS